MSDFESRVAGLLAGFVDGFQELVAAQRLSAGASQETYRLVARTEGGERLLALRRAAGGENASPGDEAPGLETEALLMRRAKEAGVPEPEVLRVLEPGDGLGDGFVMEWIEGETLGARIVRSPALEAIRPRLAYQCGEILGRIHRIDLVAASLDRRLEHLATRDFVDRVWERYRTLDSPQPMIDYTARWLLENLPPECPPTLVHNDYRNGNLVVTPDGIAGVLDWEVAHIGDPLRDLGWICTPSWRFGRADLPVGGFGEVADLLAGYEVATGRKVDPGELHYWIVFGAFWWAVGCLGMAEQYRSGPDPSVERPAIGRRSSECQVDCVNLLIPGPVRLLDEPKAQTPDLPRIDELVSSVGDFLRQEVMHTVEGRTRFLARVAANSLDIVVRELAAGASYRRAEHDGLRRLLNSDGDLVSLRRQLALRLRQGGLDLDDTQLTSHLRTTVVHQVAIDQPSYPGLQTALEEGRAVSQPSSTGKAS